MLSDLTWICLFRKHWLLSTQFCLFPSLFVFSLICINTFLIFASSLGHFILQFVKPLSFLFTFLLFLSFRLSLTLSLSLSLSLSLQVQLTCSHSIYSSALFNLSHSLLPLNYQLNYFSLFPSCPVFLFCLTWGYFFLFPSIKDILQPIF